MYVIYIVDMQKWLWKDKNDKKLSFFFSAKHTKKIMFFLCYMKKYLPLGVEKFWSNDKINSTDSFKLQPFKPRRDL